MNGKLPTSDGFEFVCVAEQDELGVVVGFRH